MPGKRKVAVDLDLQGTNRVRGLLEPVEPRDAVNLGYLNDRLSSKVGTIEADAVILSEVKIKEDGEILEILKKSWQLYEVYDGNLLLILRPVEVVKSNGQHELRGLGLYRVSVRDNKKFLEEENSNLIAQGNVPVVVYTSRVITDDGFVLDLGYPIHFEIFPVESYSTEGAPTVGLAVREFQVERYLEIERYQGVVPQEKVAVPIPDSVASEESVVDLKVYVVVNEPGEIGILKYDVDAGYHIEMIEDTSYLVIDFNPPVWEWAGALRAIVYVKTYFPLMIPY